MDKTSPWWEDTYFRRKIMAYTPTGRGDNSILSQIMKYDKSVQPAQSYTNVSQQYTPFGRMEDWETIANALGKGIGVAGKKAYGYGKEKYEEYKEGQAADEKAERDAWREEYIQDAKSRKEGYDLEDRELKERRDEGRIARRERKRKEHMGYIDEDMRREEFMRGQGLLQAGALTEEDISSAKQYYDKEQFEAQEAQTREQQVDPITSGMPPDFRYNPYNLPQLPVNVSGKRTTPGLTSSGQVQMSGPTLQRGMEELRRNPSYLASLSPKERAGLTGELDPVTGLPLSTAELRKSKDPKFYNKWKMKMKRFLEKEFGKKAPVDVQSLTPIQQRLQQLRMKSKKPSKKGTNYPSGTYTGGAY